MLNLKKLKSNFRKITATVINFSHLLSIEKLTLYQINIKVCRQKHWAQVLP